MRRTLTAAVERGLARAAPRAQGALAWAAPRALAAGRSARAGITQVLTTPDPPQAWRGAWRRRFAYATVGAVTLVLGLAALAGLYGGLGILIDA